MSLKTRKILFIIFILTFLTITPLVMSYATGYKFVFGKKIIQKTGMLILDTEPAGAKIYLNGKPEQLFFKKYYKKEEGFITTPAKIKNLTPGEYNIKLELDGYWDWDKKLEIKSGLSTFAEDINLFKKNLPLLIYEGEILESSLSSNKNNLSVLTSADIYIFNLETRNRQNLSNGTSTIKSLPAKQNTFLWSPSGNKLLVDKAIYEIKNFELDFDLSKYIKEKNVNFKWGQDNENEIFYLLNDNINILNLTNGNIKNITTSDNIDNFLVKNNYLFFINQATKATNLIVYEINSSLDKRKIELPLSLNYKFINPEHKLINLYNNKRQTLYLIDPLSIFPLKETINNIKYTYWVNENKLLYANDFEIWLVDLEYGKKTLLTRISNRIKNVIWHPSNNYVIYSTDNKIFTIELDDREKHNTTELTNLENISYSFLNEDGDTLYFNAKIGNKKGLYKLSIQ